MTRHRLQLVGADSDPIRDHIVIVKALASMLNRRQNTTLVFKVNHICDPSAQDTETGV